MQDKLMTDREIKRKINKHEIATRKKKRKCFLTSCNNFSIASHLLQKNGILNRIATDNHLFQFGIDPYKPNLFYFEKIGINKAFTFPGFCNKHDTSIFNEIESEELDFSRYRTNLLFSYRILANELRKKEILIDRFTSILNDFSLNLYLNNRYTSDLKDRIKGHKQSLKDGEYYLKHFYSDLENNTKSFTFITIELPYVEFCASGVFTYETTAEINSIPDWLWDKPLTDIYFNLLPLQDKSIAIFGCLTEMKDKCWNYISEFDKPDKNSSLKMIGDLLLTRVENWLCSESVYNHLKLYESTIMKITHESINTPHERRTLSFNLFDYMKQ